jgi:PAS domain S-box-containing protein
MKGPVTVPLNVVLFRLLTFGLFLPSLLIGLVLLIIGTYINGVAIQREQLQVTRSIAWKADDYLANAKRSLGTIALLVGSSSLSELENYMQAVQKTNLFFDTIFALDKQGIIYSISPYDSRYIDLDMSNQPYFKERTVQQTYQLSKPFISPETGTLTIYLTCNVKDGGLIVGELSLDRLQQAIGDVPKLNKNQIAFVTDQYGTLLAHPNLDWVIQQANLNLSDLQGIQSKYFPDLYINNNQVFLESSTKLNQVNWMVTSQIPLAEAIAPYLSTIAISTLVVVALWIFLVIGLRREFTRQIVTPLSRLSENVKTLALGDFSKTPLSPTIPASFSEIGELALNFAKMFQTIQSRQSLILESERKYRGLIEQSNDAICLEFQHRLEVVNQKFSTIFGITNETILNSPVNFLQIVSPNSKAYVQEIHQKLVDGLVSSLRYEFTAIDKYSHEIEVEVSSSVFDYQGGTAIQATLRDVTERIRAEKAEHEQRILAEALCDTAAALNSTLNFDEVMERILSNLGKVVYHNSSNVMLIDEDGKTARFVAARGYTERETENWVQKGLFKISEVPNLYKMFTTGKSITVPDTSLDPDWVKFPETAWIRSYAGAPIKIQERVIGFLNLNSPIPGFYNQDKAERLQAFADQAGTALHNARLLQDLQKSNVELTTAYDKTLQGWSKALELRDYSTEGHTIRVLEMTIKLARRLGITEPELSYIRYGVLLHDIGKIGIPDSILSKAGPLTDDEWEVMRRHPKYAYDILSPIPYLAPALDIPYYHHECWDGGGYPEGLAGEKIPLAARIFSIVDVWDGLRSNRPYRDGLPRDEVMQYIQEKSGIQFDPAIVEEFCKLIKEEE